jgi:predicted RNA-binding Zn-ribbon protein involved in translation (DUF1610 family)
MAEPASKEEYEQLYLENYQVTGRGIEGVTNHFPCPFCAAPDWHVVRVIDFGESAGPFHCEACGRAARIVVTRDGAIALAGAGVTAMTIRQTAGPDAPEWVPIRRDE